MNLVLENSLKNFFDPYDLIIELQVFWKRRAITRQKCYQCYLCILQYCFFFQIDHTFVSNTPLGH